MPPDPRDPWGFQHLLEAFRHLRENAGAQRTFIVVMTWLMLVLGVVILVTSGKETIPKVLIPVSVFFLAMLLAMKPPPRRH